MKKFILLSVTLFTITILSLIASGFLLYNNPDVLTSKKVTGLPSQETIIGRVINVKDGDSFTLVDDNNKFHEIRLAHVDCPEKKQAFGRKAQLYTFNFTFGKWVTAHVQSTDRYYRKICEVLVEGKNLNEGIVRNGLAWHFKKYSSSKVYNSLELLARDQKVGLWKDANAKAPWEFRKRKPTKK